jgi:hypothetical protein
MEVYTLSWDFVKGGQATHHGKVVDVTRGKDGLVKYDASTPGPGSSGGAVLARRGNQKKGFSWTLVGFHALGCEEYNAGYVGEKVCEIRPPEFGVGLLPEPLAIF